MSPASSSSKATLDNLKKTAKRWLKALRAKDEDARARLDRAYPRAPADPVLRDVQHALAREHGYENWKAMADAADRQQSPSLDLIATGGRTHADRVATFLQFACWDHHVHGKGDHLMYDRAAARVLRHHPEIARDSIYTAVVSGDLEEVERIVAARPEAAREAGGARGWTPILYLCYTRFTHQPAIDNAVAIGRALLDHGANPNDFYQAGSARYSALVGVAADGEQDSPRQPQSEALFRLLLERGAEPFDIQVLYNTHFRGEIVWWLELIHSHCMAIGRTAEWNNADWPILDMGGYGSGARFLLWTALRNRDAELAEWVLAHGANPDPAPGRAPGMPKESLHDLAVREGFTALADLLARYGAAPGAVVLDDREQFIAACLRFDRDEITAQLRKHPEYLQSPEALFAATSRDRADVVAFLLEMGAQIEIQDEKRQRALHIAAGDNALQVAALLIARGADVDPRSVVYDGTPLQYAVHYWHEEMIELLAHHSRDIWHLVFTGHVDRVGTVLRDEPHLANVTRDGCTPLWWLPDDEAKAIEIVELLLRHGTDPAHKRSEGTTAAEWALKRGMRDVAARLAR
jgi:uncharacterized protein